MAEVKRRGHFRKHKNYPLGVWVQPTFKDDVGTDFKEVKTFRKALKKGKW